MLIHGLGGLGASVAIHAVEIQGADAVRAGNTLERNRSVYRFGRVVSHITIVAAYSGGASGHWVCDFRVAMWGYCTVSVVEPAAPPRLAVTVATPDPLGYASPPG